MKLGYLPTLPKSKKDPLPSYISFIDPATGVNFGNINSEKFYVVRGDLLAELGAIKHFGADSRYAHVHLVSDDAVEALLKIAKRERSRRPTGSPWASLPLAAAAAGPISRCGGAPLTLPAPKADICRLRRELYSARAPAARYASPVILRMNADGPMDGQVIACVEAGRGK